MPGALAVPLRHRVRPLLVAAATTRRPPSGSSAAQRVPGAPEWLPPLAATTLAQGGDRRGVALPVAADPDEAEQEWLREHRGARARCSSTRSTSIDRLNAAIVASPPAGARHVTWEALVRAGWLRRVPRRSRPASPYVIDPATGRAVGVPPRTLLPAADQQAPQATPALAGRERAVTADPLVLAALAGSSGLVFGSFLNVCIHRLPRGESIVQPAVALPGVRPPLALVRQRPGRELARLRGRCTGCRARDPGRCTRSSSSPPAAVFVARLAGVRPDAAARRRGCVFACALIVLLAIDLEHRLLPNAITLPGHRSAGLAASLVLPPGLRDALLGAVRGGGVLLAHRGGRTAAARARRGWAAAT